MKVFGNRYMPFWIDQFGIKKYKTMFFSFIYMASTYGQVIGFYIGTIFFNKWKTTLN